MGCRNDVSGYENDVGEGRNDVSGYGNDVMVAGMTWGSMGRRDGCGNDATGDGNDVGECGNDVSGCGKDRMTLGMMREGAVRAEGFVGVRNATPAIGAVPGPAHASERRTPLGSRLDRRCGGCHRRRGARR